MKAAMRTGMGLRRTVAILCVLGLAVTLGAGRVEAASPKDKARAPAGELQLERHIRLRGTDVYRYRQVIDGVELIDAKAVVTRNIAGDRIVTDSTRRDVRRPGRAIVTRRAAITEATQAVGAKKLRMSTTAERALWARDGGTLVWLVQIGSAEPLGAFRVLVDATTGEVVSKANLLRHADGAAQIYDPNPVVENGTLSGLRDRRDRDSTLLTSLRRAVVLENLLDGQPCLKGLWAEARAGRKRKRVCSATLDWSGATRSAPRFEALMAYYHADRMQQYIQSLDLGAINERRQVINASSFTADNAFYDPFSKKISLGTGGVDDGEDADIIIHEYGHAVQDNQVEDWGLSFDGAAMGEGFGDYLAAVASAELSESDPTHAQDVCIADWDSKSYSPPCLRSAEIGDMVGLDNLTSFCRGEIHCAGQVWSSALFELRTELGVEGLYNVIDSVVLGSHFLLGTNPSFAAGAIMLEVADEALYPAGAPNDGQGAHYAQIHAEMVERDLLP